MYVSSTALFNDGSVVGSVTLGPYDGILLQRQTPLPAPVSRVNSVVNAASFQQAIASGGFVSIIGTGFGTTSRSWNASDFAGTNLPTSLDGISVTLNGKSAYVQYISPTQINVIAPDDVATGPVQVRVVTPQGNGCAGTVLKQKLLAGILHNSKRHDELCGGSAFGRLAGRAGWAILQACSSRRGH